MTMATLEQQAAPNLPQALQGPRMDGKPWQEQVAIALKAREMGAELRRDKPKSFREIVGRV